MRRHEKALAVGSERRIDLRGRHRLRLLALLFGFTFATTAVSAAPAFGDDFVQTLSNPVPGYTSIQVSGHFDPAPGNFMWIRFEASSDGVNYHAVSMGPGGSDCPAGTEPGNGECMLQPDATPLDFTTTLHGDAGEFNESEFRPATHYFLRLHLNRASYGEFLSNVVETTTLPVAPPTVLGINDASEVSYVSAKAAGSVEGVDGSDEAFAAKCRFEYVTDAQFAESGFENAESGFNNPQRVPCNPNPVLGSGATPVEANLTNLKPATTYHLRLTASNAGGRDSKVAASTFTTLPVEPPSVPSIDAAANVSYSQADLSGKVTRPANPDPAFDSTCRFQYIPAAQLGATNGTYRLTVRADSGTFRIKAGLSGQATEPLAYDASAAQVQSALEALPSVGPGNVSVTGGPGDEFGDTPYVLTFVGALAGHSVGFVFTEDSGLAGGSAQVETLVEGHPAEGFAHATTVPCNPATVTTPGENGVNAHLTGLVPGTTYAYRLVASNPGGSASREGPATFTTLVPGAPAVSILPPSAVTAHSVHLAGEINPSGTDPGFNVKWHFRCTPKCPGLQVETIPADETTHQVSVDASGLEANTTYSAVLVAANASARIVAGPVQFTTDAVAPVVTTFPGFSLAGGTTALLGGRVDPENSPTKYWVELGSDTSYGTSVPLSENGDAGAGTNPNFVTQKATGLQPSTTYHYRLVAESPVGKVRGADKTFTTAPATGLGSAFGGAALPDGRAWEMVSPVAKNQADVWPIKAEASASGDALAFASQGSFAGQPTAKGALLTDYLSRRGGTAWATQGITPPRGRFSLNELGYHEYSDDLRFGRMKRLETNDESLDPGSGLDPSDPVPHDRFYIRDNATGRYRLQPEGFVGASQDFGKMIVQSGEELTPTGCTFFCVYEKEGGETRLANMVEGGLGGTWEYSQYAGISKDGSRVFFVSIVLGPHLYARVNGTSTVQIDESERTVPPTGGSPGAVLAGISGASGERVLFVTPEQLVDADEDSHNDLYVWDGGKPEGSRLTLLSEGDMPGVEAEFGQVLGSAGDRLAEQSSQRGYFTASNQVIAGQPEAPGTKIYYWDAAGAQPRLSYVTTLASDTLRNENVPTSGTGEGGPATVHTSPNGRYLAFASSERLTAYDNGGHQEIYRYDGIADQLICVSCDPEGRPARSAAQFNMETIAESSYVLPHLARSVTDDGRTFFEAKDNLSPKDSNGQTDVYEYSEGAPQLISSGRNPEGARFLDASASGNDVFFVTSEPLVGWDRGDDLDAYDARVGGGLPEPPPPAIGCDGDSCQPAPNPPNDPTPASSNFNGAGNERVARKHKKAHKQKRRKRQHKKRRRAGKSRATTHRHG
ncbi:MAG TPA: hypothetical protein VHA54_02905 [Solirubrobacterales bacterium]|nr:hypothetical protein [Solirubrobacterales bacterium]